MTRRIIICTSALLLALHGNAQHASYEWFLNANINIHIPGGDSQRSIYPVLGYNKKTTPKLLLGGIGTGAFLLRSISSDFHLKAHGYLSKISYWDDPVELKGVRGENVAVFQAGGSDYVMGINGLVHYHLADRLSLGAGFGTQFFSPRSPGRRIFTATASPLANRLSRITITKEYSRLSRSNSPTGFPGR